MLQAPSLISCPWSYNIIIGHIMQELWESWSHGVMVRVSALVCSEVTFLMDPGSKPSSTAHLFIYRSEIKKTGFAVLGAQNKLKNYWAYVIFANFYLNALPCTSGVQAGNNF